MCGRHAMANVRLPHWLAAIHPSVHCDSVLDPLFGAPAAELGAAAPKKLLPDPTQLPLSQCCRSDAHIRSPCVRASGSPNPKTIRMRVVQSHPAGWAGFRSGKPHASVLVLFRYEARITYGRHVHASWQEPPTRRQLMPLCATLAARSLLGSTLEARLSIRAVARARSFDLCSWSCSRGAASSCIASALAMRDAAACAAAVRAACTARPLSARAAGVGYGLGLKRNYTVQTISKPKLLDLNLNVCTRQSVHI